MIASREEIVDRRKEDEWWEVRIKGVWFFIKINVHKAQFYYPLFRAPNKKFHNLIHPSTCQQKFDVIERSWRCHITMFSYTTPFHYTSSLSLSYSRLSLSLSPIRGLVSSGISQNAGTLSRKSSQSDPSDFPSGFVSDFPFHFLHFLCFNSELYCFSPFHSQRGLSQLLSTM
jgi:hypothetical protein